jgi:hypothetical protein
VAEEWVGNSCACVEGIREKMILRRDPTAAPGRQSRKSCIWGRALEDPRQVRGGGGVHGDGRGVILVS